MNEFNIGDRVIIRPYGAGIIVERRLHYGDYAPTVVFDKPHSGLHNNGDENLPANRCGRFYETNIKKELL